MKKFLQKMLVSFTSRKFLVAVTTACLLFFDKKLGLGLNLEEKAIAASIGAFWILAESLIDFRAVNTGITPQSINSALENAGIDPQDFAKNLMTKGLELMGLGSLVPGAAPSKPLSELVAAPMSEAEFEAFKKEYGEERAAAVQQFYSQSEVAPSGAPSDASKDLKPEA